MATLPAVSRSRATAIVATVALLASAWVAIPAEHARAATPGAALAGTVSQRDGSPVEGARVTAERRDGGGFVSAGTTTADAAGAYSFAGLATGVYTLHFEAPAGSQLLDEWWDDRRGTSADAGDTLVLADGDAVTADATLDEPGRIVGTVEDGDGAPVAGTGVDAVRDSSGDGVEWGGGDTTAADGSFEITGLIEGDYRVELMLGQLYSETVSVTLGDAVRQDFSVSSGAVVGGTVTGSDGRPRSGVSVTATSLGGGYESSATTDDSGTYRIIGLAAGSYTVAFAADGTASRYAGDVTNRAAARVVSISSDDAADVDFVFAGTTVSGRVALPGGGSAAGARLTLQGADGRTTATTRTDDDGEYVFTDIPAGSYALRATAKAGSAALTTWWGGAVTSATAAYFDVAGERLGRDIQLAAGGSLTGSATTSTGAAAQPAVSLYRWSAGAVSLADQQVTVADDGSFVVEGLATGEYTLEFGATSDTGHTWLGGARSGAAALHVSVTAGQTSSLAAVVLPAAGTGSIAGTVDASGVTDWSVVTAEVTGAGRTIDVPVDDGRFTAGGLDADGYTVHILGIPGFDDAWYGGVSSATATRVAVAQGAQASIVLTPAARTAGVSGIVTRVAVGLPAAGDATVSLRQQGSDVDLAQARTTDDGAYEFAATIVPGRTYVLSASPDDDETLRVEQTFTAVAGSQKRDLALPAAGSVGGSVVDAVTGDPIAGLAVSLSPASGSTEPHAISDADGRFRLARITPASYRLQYGAGADARAGSAYYGTVWHGGSAAEDGSTAVPVAGGTAADAGETKAGRAGIVRGVITAIVGGTTVRLDGAVVTAYTTAGKKVANTSSGAVAPGVYSLSLPQGAYRICASGPAAGAYAGTIGSGCWTTGGTSGSAVPAAGGDVAVDAGGERAGIDLRLAPLAVLTAPTPVVSGTPSTLSTLTAVAGAWTAGTTLSFQWFANGAAVAGATGATFRPGVAHDGMRIAVAVSGAKPGYLPATRTSAATAPVLRAAVPAVAGTVAYGYTVSVSAGTWSSGVARSFQWYANGSAISGATKSTLKIGSSLKGKQLSVRVTGKKSGYPTVAATSAKTARVATTSAPKIIGTARVGSKLAVSRGTWTAGTSFSYQWYANGAAIKGATKSRLTLTSGTAGKRITVLVTGRKSGYATVARTSSATAKVKR